MRWTEVDIPGETGSKKALGKAVTSGAELLEEQAQYLDSPEIFLEAKIGRPHTLHCLYYPRQKVLSEARLSVTGFRQFQLSARGMGL